MSEALLSALTLVTTLPCLAEPGKIIVVARPSQLLSGVLPYINAVLPNVVSYSPAAGTMTLRRRPGFITLYPDKVYIIQVKDVDEGIVLLDALRDLLNQIWSRRDEIIPSAKARQRPGFLEIWKLLPRLRCQRCGQPGCLAFAVKLAMGLAMLDECPLLREQRYAGFHAQLQAIVGQPPALAEERS
jgi:ArsR family metal-binding transcriptional regulator